MRSNFCAVVLGGVAAVVGFRLLWRIVADMIRYKDIVLETGEPLSYYSAVLLTFASLWLVITGLRLAIRGH